jgi:dTDP-4-amino-4,6-dideoxygalactose transaminase
LDATIAHKRALAEIYFSELTDWMTKPIRRNDEYDVFHIFGLRHPQRDALCAWLLERGFKTEVHYPIPPHRQKAMIGILAGSYPLSDAVHAMELSLPISNGQAPREIHQVCQCLADGRNRFAISE